MKYLVRAIAATTTLAALLFCNSVAAQDGTSNNGKPASTEAMLLAGTGIWSGGINPSRPGCTNAHGCMKGAMTFQFFKNVNRKLALHIIVTTGDTPYNDAVARKTYAGSADMKASDDAWMTKIELLPGNEVVFRNSYEWKCTISPQEADCGRVSLNWNTSDIRSHDGWVYKFKLYPWPPS